MLVPGFAEDSVYDLTIQVNEDSQISEEARENRRKLIHAYTAQLSGDFDTWWNLFDKDVAFQEAPSLPYGCSVKGLEAAKAGVGGLFDSWKRLELTLEEFTAAGDLVIAYLRLRATSRKTGKVYDQPGTEYFRFKNGKVIDWTAFYWDTHLVRQLCGEE